GKGIGSELIKGLVDFYRNQRVSSIAGGVAKDNLASKRVLEKMVLYVIPLH
ncbi:MAG: GNAT family N-acetyltransferase, partial [Gammaproteobacteria bacterium]|nr:GNAT family N-acetyltransferase [Gammaproteobacteria bacterium]